MRIVVVGGSGHIGAKLVALLTADGHETVAASRRSGVDVLTGEGLAAAITGTDAVVDVSRAPTYGDADVFDFFTRSTRHQLQEGAAAGLPHHLALSVVGAGAMGRSGSGFMRAKAAQEELIAHAGIPYTILAATQFFEFFPAIADHATVDGEVRLPPVHNQPIAGLDVARVLARLTVEPPRNASVEVGGPERMPLAEFVSAGLAARGDARPVVVDETVRYFGARLDDDTLVPGPGALRGDLSLSAWLESGE